MPSRTDTSWGPRLLIGIVLLYVGLLILWPVAAIFQGAFSQGVEAVLQILAKPDVQKKLFKD